MEDELVLFTSFFNLVDGRRQEASDTFRVDTNLPSASSPDGTAALYIITEASTGGHMGPRARRVASDTIAWEYASHRDESPSTRLKAALRTAHQEILRQFEGHVAVGATIMSVERDSVYLAQVAPAQVYVLHDGSLHSIPAVAEGSSPFGRALGCRTSPQISVFRDQIAPGDVLALCSTWFDRAADSNDVRVCFEAGTADEIAEGLLDLAQQHDVRDATAIVVEAALSHELEMAPDGHEHGTLLEQVDMAMQALAGVGRMLLQELRPAAPEGTERAAEVEREPAHASATTTEVPLVDTIGARAVSRPDPEVSRAAAIEPASSEFEITEAPSQPVPEPEPGHRDEATDEMPAVTPDIAVPVERPAANTEPATAPPQPPLTEMEQVNSRIQNAPDLGNVIPPVQAFEDTGTEPARIYPTSRDIDAVNRRPRRYSDDAVPVIRPGMTDIDLRQPVTRPTPSWVIWATAAIVLVIAAAAAVYFVRNHTQTRANPYPGLVAQDLKLAKGSTTPAQQDAYLAKANHNLALAQQNGSSQQALAGLKRRILTTTDLLHHITRVTNPVLLTDFSRFPGAQPTQIAASPGVVYVVDPSRKSVFSVTATAGARPAEIVQDGDTYSGFTVSVPEYVDTDGSTAVILDKNNVLVRDTSGTKTATSLTSQAQTPGSYAAMAVSDPDVYLLDTANSQVWRYPYAVSGYNPTQAAYWDSNPPKLSNADSLAFDRADMYILKKDGTVLKFDFQANPQKFAINLKTPLSNPVALYTDAGQRWIWIADPAHNRILQLGKDGTYDRTYQSASSMDLTKIRSICAGPQGNTLYVLAGSRLYSFPVQP